MAYMSGFTVSYTQQLVPNEHSRSGGPVGLDNATSFTKNIMQRPPVRYVRHATSLPYAFRLGALSQSLYAIFSPVANLFRTTKRCIEQQPVVVVVQEDDAGLNLAAHSQVLLLVASIDETDKTILRLINNCQSLLSNVICWDCDTGPNSHV